MLIIIGVFFKDAFVRAILKILLHIYYVVVYSFNVYGSPTKIPMSWNPLAWNYPAFKTFRTSLIEWNYHMVFTDKITGSVGLCVVNPNKLPLIPSGVILICYGVSRKNYKPFCMYRITPVAKDKYYPSLEKDNQKNPLEFYYTSEKTVCINIKTPDFELCLNITNTSEKNDDYILNDNNLGPLG